MNRFIKYAGTLIGILVAGSGYGVSLFLDIEIFESFEKFLRQLETVELDELIIGVIAVAVGVIFDMRRSYNVQRRKLEINREKLRTLRATMRKVDDIVGNAMNGMLLFQMEAKKSRALSEESIEMFDNMIRETADKVREIGRVKTVTEKEVAKGVYVLDMEHEERPG